MTKCEAGEAIQAAMNVRRKSCRGALPAVLATAVALFDPALVGVSSAAQDQLRVGNVPRHPTSSKVIGALASTTGLTIAVTLKPRDPAGLAQYATAVSTPSSSLYRRYMSVDAFVQRFGPTAAEIAAVETSLRSHGLVPGAVAANHLMIPVVATAGVVAHGFSLSFERVRLASGRVAFANTQAPLVDASVASAVQGVIGLDSLSVARPAGLEVAPSDPSHGAVEAQPNVVTGGPQPCSTAVSDAAEDDAYTADQLASAYSFSSLYGAGDEGAGQTVALYELEPNSTSDIAAYQTCYGTNTSLKYVEVDGGAGSGSGSGEAALDIEDLVGLAPEANILVYQGPNAGSGPYDTYNSIVSQDRASVVSTSWYLCEPETSSSYLESENTLFEEAATQGQSIFAAAGDYGSEGCYGVSGDTALALDDPSSQPFVTGVGGTSLTALGPPPTQTVWNDICGPSSSPSPCGGGGGISSFWTMPSYQSGAPASLNVINADSSGAPCGAPTKSHCREVPDVSADADPNTGYLIRYRRAWLGIGGTSAASPLWAAFMALANASSECGGTPIGFANPALYTAAASAYSDDFDDITSGDNDVLGDNGGLFPAGTGYDMASGLGSPIGSTLAANLCPAATNPSVQR